MEPTSIQKMAEKCRSLEQALNDLRAERQKHPTATLDRMITVLEAELAERSGKA